MKRRDFHKSALSLGACSLAATQSHTIHGANDRVRIAILGCGVRGSSHISDLLRLQDPAVEISHVCDVWSRAREQAAARIENNKGKAPAAVSNYEEVLSSSEVDAVIIATPDFQHARMLREAAEAGKDAYCEKPMATDLKEAVAAVDAVREHKRVVQVGTQWRSDPHFVACAKAIQSGVLGRITRIAIAQNFHEPRWRKPYNDVQKQDVDWDRFQMHAPAHDFDPKRFKRWYLYQEYTNGLPGLWMSHFLNLVLLWKKRTPPESPPAGQSISGRGWTMDFRHLQCDS